MTASNERIERLAALLRQSLAAYVDGTVSLPRLVSDVESLISGFSEVADNDWVEELRSNWWHLEFAYAMSADEERPLNDEERTAVDEAVKALDAMLVGY